MNLDHKRLAPLHEGEVNLSMARSDTVPLVW